MDTGGSYYHGVTCVIEYDVLISHSSFTCSLGSNNIGDAGAQALAGLQHCTNLQVLE